MHIRRALPGEAGLLSGLALRSKAHWGYPAAFIEACRPELTLSAEYISENPVYVIKDERGVLGFYSLKGLGEQVELDYLFVEPEAIGLGLGKRLWQHAVSTARQLDYRELIVVSDPFALDFYRAMGAVPDGQVPSTVEAARLLPLLRFRL